MSPGHEGLFERLRAAECSARERLVAGCADDISKVGAFLDRPLAAAREEVALERASPSAYAVVATRCAERVAGNAALHTRARLKIYTNELAAAECPIARAVGAALPGRVRRPLPRMFPVRVNEFERQPPHGVHENTLDGDDWVERLRECLARRTIFAMLSARDRILALGHERLGIVRARMALAGLLDE